MADRVLITRATPGRTLDVETRQRRYLWSMLLRVVCFVLAFFLPGIWRWIAILGAVFLPAIAVLFGNASDHRPVPLAEDEEQDEHLALPGPNTIRGEVAE